MEVLIHQAGIFAGLELRDRRLDDVPHLAAPFKAMGPDLVGRQQVRHLEVLLRRIGHQGERIVGLAQKPTGLPIGQIAAAPPHQLRQHHKGRQVGTTPLEVRQHGARMWCLNASGESPTGLHHLPPGVVHGRPIVVARPDQRKLVGDGRMTRQQFGNFERVGFRADGLERPANLGRGIGLHVPQVDVAGAAQVEDHDARTPVVHGLQRTLLLGLQVLRQRQADRRQRPHLQELPP